MTGGIWFCLEKDSGLQVQMANVLVNNQFPTFHRQQPTERDHPITFPFIVIQRSDPLSR